MTFALSLSVLVIYPVPITLRRVRQLQIFKGHTGAVTCMSVDATGKILYTAGADACIKSWNIATGQMLKVGQSIIFSARMGVHVNISHDVLKGNGNAANSVQVFLFPAHNPVHQPCRVHIGRQRHHEYCLCLLASLRCIEWPKSSTVPSQPTLWGGTGSC